MTVFNDRSEGGSAYKNGRIELMVNRKMFKDDNLGMSEVLFEHDNQFNGFNVSATYVLSFTNNRK